MHKEGCQIEVVREIPHALKTPPCDEIERQKDGIMKIWRWKILHRSQISKPKSKLKKILQGKEIEGQGRNSEKENPLWEEFKIPLPSMEIHQRIKKFQDEKKNWSSERSFL